MGCRPIELPEDGFRDDAVVSEEHDEWAVVCEGLCGRCREGVGEARGLGEGLLWGLGDTRGLPFILRGLMAVAITPLTPPMDPLIVLVGEVCCRGKKELVSNTARNKFLPGITHTRTYFHTCMPGLCYVTTQEL